MIFSKLTESTADVLNTQVDPIVGALFTVLGFTVVVVAFAVFLTFVRKNKK